jgi:uncharacterized membrane protein YdjX (TVP38/TMEM64 family)
MKQYWTAVSCIVLLFLISFLVVEQLQIPLLTDLHTLMPAANATAAVAGILLLMADVLIPVPSTLVMLLNGGLFGILPGAFFSLVGSLGAAWIGFSLGRLGSPWFLRFIPADQMSRANHLLKKWGLIAIIITRPVPLLAETMAVVAGASALPWNQLTLAAFLGSLPTVILYAAVGATAVTLNSSLFSFVLVILIAALFWYFRESLHKTFVNKFGR